MNTQKLILTGLLAVAGVVAVSSDASAIGKRKKKGGDCGSCATVAVAPSCGGCSGGYVAVVSSGCSGCGSVAYGSVGGGYAVAMPATMPSGGVVTASGTTEGAVIPATGTVTPATGTVVTPAGGVVTSGGYVVPASGTYYTSPNYSTPYYGNTYYGNTSRGMSGSRGSTGGRMMGLFRR